LERLNEAQGAMRRTDDELRALCEEAGVADADVLPDAEGNSQRRREAERACDELDDRLLDLSPGQTVEELIAEVEREDPDRIEPRIEELTDRLKALKSQRDALLVEIGSVQRELSQMDGSAEAAQAQLEVELLLGTLGSKVQRYARLRIGGVVLRRAMERFREKHQAPLLERAGNAFAKLTLGSFDGLRADYDEGGGDVLVGIRGNGGATLGIKCMSDGTADQLYFAFRLAGLSVYLEEHEALPFIVDDVLVNFDDERAEAALRLLAAFSRRTQVIFFTHHRHLVDLACSALDQDEVFVHELGGRA